MIPINLSLNGSPAQGPDRDQVPDAIDRCPTVPNPAQGACPTGDAGAVDASPGDAATDGRTDAPPADRGASDAPPRDLRTPDSRPPDSRPLDTRPPRDRALPDAPVPDQGGPVGTSFAATADTWVSASSPTVNHGTATTISADLVGPESQVFLRFSVTGLVGAVASARVRLYAVDPTWDGPQILRTGSSWSETTLTWNTKLAPQGSPLDDKGAITTGTWVDFDVTAAVTGNGTYNFVLIATSGDGADFTSREGTAAQRPRLTIVTK